MPSNMNPAIQSCFMVNIWINDINVNEELGMFAMNFLHVNDSAMLLDHRWWPLGSEGWHTSQLLPYDQPAGTTTLGLNQPKLTEIQFYCFNIKGW